MTRKTTYSSKNGSLTGKTVTTTSSDGSRSITHYKATGGGLSRALLGPSWSHRSTTKVDARGNSRTTTAKKSSWW